MNLVFESVLMPNDRLKAIFRCHYEAVINV